jgi:hypothetical protein
VVQAAQLLILLDTQPLSQVLQTQVVVEAVAVKKQVPHIRKAQEHLAALALSSFATQAHLLMRQA